MIVNKKSYYLINVLSDLLFVSIIYSFCYDLVGDGEFGSNQYNLLFGLVLFWYFYSKSSLLYDDYRSREFIYQLTSIFKNIFAQAIIMILVYFLFKHEVINRKFIVVYSLSLTLILTTKYYLQKLILSYFRVKGKNVRYVLLIGGGELGYNFFKTIKENPNFGYKIIGILDDKQKSYLNGEYLGKIEDLESILISKNIDDVVIALPHYAFNSVNTIINISNRFGIRTRIIPDYDRYLSKKFQVSVFGDFPIITLRGEPLEEAHWRLLKRSFDILFSSFVLLFILSWLIPLIALINKFTSPGPVFFKQDRIGQKNKTFGCYKFRSMRVESSKNKAEYKAVSKEDPRITRFGKILRKSNLDELPQFINVFKGEMSVVGPRPHAIAWNDKYSEYVEEIRLRHRVKPGITGWAQVHGFRGDVEDEELNKKRTRKRIELDLWYIENWTFLLDIQIIFLTVWRMLKGDPNAY